MHVHLPNEGRAVGRHLIEFFQQKFKYFFFVFYHKSWSKKRRPTSAWTMAGSNAHPTGNVSPACHTLQFTLQFTTRNWLPQMFLGISRQKNSFQKESSDRDYKKGFSRGQRMDGILPTTEYWGSAPNVGCNKTLPRSAKQCTKLSNAYILFSWSVIQASKEIQFLWSLKAGEGCFRSLVDAVFEELLTMNKTCEMEPVLIRVVFPNGFSCLQKVLNLWFVKVGVTLVNKLIQEFTTIPNAHHCFIQL